MRMLFLLTVLGFLFIMANKSPDETIQETAGSMLDKSKTMARTFLDAPKEHALTRSKLSDTATSIEQKRHKTVEKSTKPAQRPVKPSIKTSKPETPLITSSPRKIAKIETPWSPPSNVYGSPPLLKTERPQSQKPLKRTPEKTEKNNMGVDTAKMPPPLPKAKSVQKRPTPPKPKFPATVNNKLIKELRKRERELQDDATRILMSIK